MQLASAPLRSGLVHLLTSRTLFLAKSLSGLTTVSMCTESSSKCGREPTSLDETGKITRCGEVVVGSGRITAPAIGRTDVQSFSKAAIWSAADRSEYSKTEEEQLAAPRETASKL